MKQSNFQRLQRTLGATVKSLRLARGLSQEQLAFDADIDRTYVSQIERALINPSLLVLHKLANVLGVTVSTLVSSPRAD